MIFFKNFKKLQYQKINFWKLTNNVFFLIYNIYKLFFNITVNFMCGKIFGLIFIQIKNKSIFTMVYTV